MDWAIKKYVLISCSDFFGSSGLSRQLNLEYRNEFYNSKEGRLLEREAALAATDGGPVRA